MNVLIYTGASEAVPAEYRGAADEAFARRLEPVAKKYLTEARIIPDAAADVEISLTFRSAEEIAALNSEYRKTEGPTDVLSFPMWEAEDGSFLPPQDWEVLPLGDIVVCPEIVAKNAVENGKTFEQETALVIFHGVLHLTGHDHDTEAGKAEMWRLQDAMVAEFFDDGPTRQIDDTAARALMEAAHAAREKAYAPYSHFKVGAALLFGDGTTISGCNVENASYGISLCAERNAMTTAITAGAGKPLAVAIAGERGRACPPCGACRQFLAEFNIDMKIILEDGDNMKFYKLSELLPACFSHGSMEGE